MLTPFQTFLLATAKRRTIQVDFEASLTGVTRAEVAKAIRALLRQKLIYQSSAPAKNFFGTGFAGYRAN
jgi:hypothetical protein